MPGFGPGPSSDSTTRVSTDNSQIGASDQAVSIYQKGKGKKTVQLGGQSFTLGRGATLNYSVTGPDAAEREVENQTTFVPECTGTSSETSAKPGIAIASAGAVGLLLLLILFLKLKR